MDNFYKEQDGQLSFVKPLKLTERRNKYSYTGPVFLFDKTIATVTLVTWAVSPNEAYAHMLYQVKEQLGYNQSTKLTIVRNRIKKEELKYGKTV